MVIVDSGRWMFCCVYLFCLLFCDVYFRLLDAEKNNASIILRFAFDKIDRVSWLNDFLAQLDHAHKIWPTVSIV